MEKINVVELLKDCPKGMELDCLLCNSPIALESVVGDESTYSIKAVGKDGFHHVFTAYGESYNHEDAKCVIFPKGKTTWEGFVPPCKFKDGDVLFHSDSASNGIFIFKEILQRGSIQKVICYCDYDSEDGFCLGENHTCCWADSKILHPATKEQCNLLFQKIKEAGYKWNAETKTLEKLPKFKVGARIRNKKTLDTHIIHSIDEYSYCCGLKSIWIYDQDEYELVSDKFDITTLKAFESRVLVRSNEEASWIPTFWGYESMTGYVTTFGEWRYCIPYEGNEHLMGKTDDCDKYFKTWE